MTDKQYYFTFKGIWKRCKKEYHYYMDIPWTLEQVGNFWDTVTDYDDVNSKIYPYFRRFTNSYRLARRFLKNDKYDLLDIQARSGNGTLFWHKKGKLNSAVCADFSDYLASLAKKRLENTDLKFKSIKILNYPLPFKNKTFNFVCSYETVEHVFDYSVFIKELHRVMTDDGVMIVTCPTVAWEWVHWLTAIININHSEGPHRFIRRKKLLRAFRKARLKVLRENTTIFLPFNNKFSIFFDKFLEKNLSKYIKKMIGLRRTFVLKKI
jgi:ubiquinone/menaquinone biosynthesis C-methylase UbiE